MLRMNWMKAWKVTAVFAALLMLPLFSPAASASGFSLGGSFRIGGVHLNLAFGDFGFGHPRGTYYRTADPIAYGQTRCNSYCFDDGGYHYHHESCPLVARHLAYYDVDPFQLFSSYIPGYQVPVYRQQYGYNDYGNRYNRGYDYRQYPQYDQRRYDRRQYDHRTDRRGRYDDHRRHDRSDRYDRYPYPSRGHDNYSPRDRNSRDRGQGRSNRSQDRHHRGQAPRAHPQHH